MSRFWWLACGGLIDRELRHDLSDERKRRVAERANHDRIAATACARARRIVILIAVVLPALLALAFLRKHWFLTRWMGADLVIIALMAGSLVTAMALVWRPPLRGPIRRALRQEGYEVCIACGHWLRELPNQRARCPECGSPREPEPIKDALS